MYKRNLLACLFQFLLLIHCGCKSSDEPTDSLAVFPTTNLQIICPWGAGGGTDRISRYFATELKRRLGNNCVVVNRTGGGGGVGHKAGADAEPDGHTIAMITAELSTMHQLGITEITYKHYQPLLQINGDPAAILVKKGSLYDSLNDFLDAVRKSPGSLKMSGTASGGTWDLARVGLFQKAGLVKDDIIWVPSKGSAESIQMLLGGHLDAVCCSLPEAALQLAAGELRGIAVMAEKRDRAFPEIATAIEQGVEWSSIGWRGFATQRDVPPRIVAILTRHLTDIATSEEYVRFMEEQGFAIEVKVGADFESFLERQDEQWKSVLEYYVKQ